MLEVFLSCVTLAVGGTILGSFRFQRRRLQRRRKLVESFGFTVTKISSYTALWLKLTARADAVTLRIEDAVRRGYPIRITAAFPGPPGFSGVRIRREEDRPPGAREIEIGDDLFDGNFFVEGPTRLMSVLLNAETRGLLLQLNSGGRLEIHRSEIRVDTYDGALPVLLPLVLNTIQRFSQEVDIAERLAENAQQDTEAGVRLRNLLLLAREFPGDPRTAEALRAGCTDESPQIRLRAAMELGAEARDILLEFAESTEKTVSDEFSALAVSRLDRDLPFERTRAILNHALRKRRHQTARACLEVIGRSGDSAAAGLLEKVLEVEQGELAAAAAQALGTAGSTATEPVLITALQRERTDIRVAAAKALGRIGSAAAVLPLKEAERESRDDELRRALRQAIAEIQARLPGASAGQLSLAGAEAGQLSLAQAEAGQLSLATDQAGELSLPPEGPEPPSPV